MTGKANAVFWIGLVLIFANFWVTGQSTTFWSIFSTKGPGASGGTSKGKKKTTVPIIPDPVIPLPPPIPPFI